ncbi:hypothetical protein GOP47_0006971 [Adiantum capillus-veneris]|uniref:C3H1-type domain-containing protein n=1 Tax=Adiantum capillus-veneris TaxID=13818 RepID=A0A9D4V0M0_ADICA|nr:hypothetical protein GOP47_0006971 [Adiantum capillus-veneris]
MDEEAQRRNTDCIYFLASPLTCKKGTNCEYRHSEAARMNPRDCRFWKAGNCLNPRCSFRHLPLDGKSVLAASVASTSSAPVVVQLAPATGPSNKSKIPCYFFSQGYCAKSDKCPFAHVEPTASGPDPATHKFLAVGVNGNAVESSGRPLVVLKQSSSTDGRTASSKGIHASKVPINAQKVPQISRGLQKFNFPARNGNFTPLNCTEEDGKPNVYGGRLHSVEQSQLKVELEQGLNDTFDKVQTAEWRHPNQVDALWEDCPLSGSGLDQSVGHFDSHLTSKSRSNSTSSNDQDSCEQLRSSDSSNFPLDNREPQPGWFSGQCQVFSKPVVDARLSYHARAEKWKKQRTSIEEVHSLCDLHSHLGNQWKKNKLHAVLEKPEVRGQTDMVIHGRGSQWFSKDHLIAQNGKLLATADSDGTKVGGRGNSAPLQRASLRKVPNTDKCLTLDKKQSGSSEEISKADLNFAGPKSLAQIKAEKMARRVSPSKTAGKHNLSLAVIEAGEKVAATREVAKPAEVTHVAVSSGNLSSSHLSTGSTAKSVDDKQMSETSSPFECPKPLSVLLKRKRELESDRNVRETISGFLKVEECMVDSCGELEDGEVRDDSEECQKERVPSSTCPSVSVEEDQQAISLSFMEVVQKGAAEAAEFDPDFSEELKSDAEMEDIAYDDADYSLDDDNDDDDEDFAKKLGRFLGLSSN